MFDFDFPGDGWKCPSANAHDFQFFYGWSGLGCILWYDFIRL